MDCVYHYTKLESLQCMLNDICLSRKDRYLSFLASSAYCMDDQTEMNFGYPLIQCVLRELEREQHLTKSQSMSEMTTAIFNYICKPSDKYFLPKSKTPFSISFSHSYDNEYMWKNYGDDGHGVCLFFDEGELEKYAHSIDNTYLFDIAYLDTENYETDIWQSLIDTICNEAIKCHTLTPILKNLSDAPKLKHKVLELLCPVISASIKDGKYHREEEVRMICVRDDKIARSREKANGQTVQYIEIKLPLCSLKGIQCGTNFNDIDKLYEICKESGIYLSETEIKLNY